MNTELEQTKENGWNWASEAENLEKQTPWFNPAESGKYEIKIVAEGGPYSTTYDGKEIQKFRFDIKVGDSEDIINWGVTKGVTTSSLYGQLALIGRAKGTLVGEKVTLMVKKVKDRTGKEKREYTVEEALKLMK